MAVDVSQETQAIRTAVMAKDVRDSIANGIDAVATEVNTYEATLSADNDQFKADITAEEAQHAQAESARVTAENGRVIAENSRVTAENGRVTAETARETAFAGMQHVDANLELTAARQGKDTLLANLQDKDTQLADIAINVLTPPSSIIAAATGDGSTDDTNAIQSIIDYCATNNKTIYFPYRPNGYKITAGLIFKTGLAGIKFEKFDSSGQIKITGTGYTGIEIQANMGLQINNLSVSGSGNTVNGIKIDGHIGLNNIKNIRVYNLNGFGLQINALWDSIIENISVELCGNATEYAFSINDDGDTTNHTVFNKIQVEQSNVKAIYVSPNTLNCIFIDIHSERTTGDGTNYTHILQGNSCTYENARIEASTNVKVKLGSVYGSYTDFRCSNAIVDVGYGLRAPISIKNLNCATFNNIDVAHIFIENLTCDVFNDTQEFLTVKDLSVATTFNYSPVNNNCILKIYDSNISASVTNNYSGTLEIYNSNLNNYVASYFSKLINCSITDVSNNYNGMSNFINCNITNIEVKDSYCLLKLFNTIVAGNISITSGNNPVIIFDSTTSVIGTIDNIFLQAPTKWGWNVGDKTYNPKPTAGGYLGLVCTIAGSQGTWKGFGLIQS